MRSPYSFLLSFIIGGAAAFAMPPVGLFFLLIPALAWLYTRIDSCLRHREAFFHTYLFFFGFHVTGLYWIGNALLIEGNPYLWAYPLALVGLPAFLALYYGTAGALFHRFRSGSLLPDMLFLTALLGLTEIVRGYLLTGFPWNQPSHAFVHVPAMLQWLSVLGPYGLNLFVLWGALLFGITAHEWRKKRLTRSLIIATAITALLFAAMFAWGALRLHNNPTTYVPDRVVRVVQPNILQSEKWNSDFHAAHYKQLMDLTTKPKTHEGVMAIVWPETALHPMMLNTAEDASLLADTLRTLGPNTRLITGMLRYTPNASGEMDYFNSIVVWDSLLEIKGIYDKSHLVPFGEYIPFDNIIKIAPIVQFSGFVPGHGPTSLNLGAFPAASPLICYEVIFPHAVMPDDPLNKRERPQWIVNSTNDGWYGNSWGPRQHFAQSRFRAIEEGTPVVRSANTGISGVIDAYGRVLASGKMNESWYADVELPRAISAPFYARVGNLLFWLCVISLCVPCAVRKRYNRKG